MSDTTQWATIKMIDVFTINGGYYNKKPPMSDVDASNVIPFLGASDSNNGITGFVKKENIKIWDKVGKKTSNHSEKRIFSGNAIAVTNNGSVGNAYYMENEFTCSHDINVLYLKNRHLTKGLAMFLITCIERSAEGFSYSIKWRPKRMIKSKMLLPVTSNQELNWEYMEKVGADIYKKQKKNIIENIKRKKEKLKSELLEKEKKVLKNVDWDIYEIKDLFDTKRVVGNTFESYDHGNLPFVTTSSINNGIRGFISAEKEDTSPAKSLTINPIAGTVFYHSSVFVGRGGAGSSIISLTNEKLNKYNSLFMKTVIEASSKVKASYGVQLNGKRLKATKIQLPITNNNELNWEYMELYIKKIEHEKLSELIKYLENSENNDIKINF